MKHKLSIWVFAFALSWSGFGTVRAQSSVPVKIASLPDVSPSSRRTRSVNPSLAETNSTGAESRKAIALDAPSAPERMQHLVRRALIGTLLAGALAGVLFFAVGGKRKALGRTLGRGSSAEGPLELLATLSIAPRCSISLLQVQGQAVLVARDASGVKNMLLLQPTFESFVSGTDAPGVDALSPDLHVVK